MWKLVNKQFAPNGYMQYYILKDERGNCLNVRAEELLPKLKNGVTVQGLTIDQVYYDMFRTWKVEVTDGTNYGVTNVRMGNKKKVTKEELIKRVEDGSVYLTNVFLRRNNNGTVSVVCKNPEEVKRVDSMTREHYVGVLGDFWYDNEEFEIKSYYVHKQYLHYIGKGKKASEIKIPEGILSCFMMFTGLDCHILEEAPIIPNSVTDCYWMFAGCSSLKKAPVIPNGVTNCEHMFEGCESLEKAPKIPNSVTNCNRMFSGCKSLKEAPELPNRLKHCEGMFAECESLKEAPEIPYGVENCWCMFEYCSSLEKAPSVIPNSVTKCNNMFWGCRSLKKAPKIPNSVTECCDMFRECSRLEEAPKIPNSVISCEYMFKDCRNLKEAPEIPATIKRENRRGIFSGCGFNKV